MAELFLEIFCEEIPARMQAKAERDLQDAVLKGLREAGLGVEKAASMSGPRRLAVVCEGVPTGSDDVTEERKGPKVGAPDKAVEGFLRGAGLSSIDEAEVRSDPKKGDFYVAKRTVPGRATPNIVSELIPDIMRNFHWPKSMRTGRGEMRWVRPLQRIVCLFDGKVVPFEVDGIASGNETEGHRVHGRGPFKITGVDDYVAQLSGKGHVLLTRDARREKIETEAKAICKKAGLELVEDKGLLEEVVGLAEWPMVILGEMDPAFLELPPEVIQLSMRTHQKYFAVRDPKTGTLAPNFVVVANIDAADGGKAIAAGNRKVLSARLEDGRFFWENDKKTGLDVMAPKLGKIDFKKELGTIADKVDRVAALARELAPAVGADADLAERAAHLAKADLVSEMVYEFPELQGVMGRYYAIEAGEDARVADAIRDHYKPQGPSDAVPMEPVSIAVALADKLDTLVGFWAIDEKPTGSKDPFALRRAALGVVRIEIENDIDLNIRHFVEWLFENVWKRPYPEIAEIADHLAWFIDQRLAIALKDSGGRHDHVEAALSVESGVTIHARIVKRVEALAAFLDSEDGANLLAGYKRAANILRAEEKKDKRAYDGDVDAAKLSAIAETALHKAVVSASSAAKTALEQEDFAAAMSALASLRAPVDAFFDGPDSVMVNADDSGIRENRLNLLNMMREAIGTVADFSKIEG
ncbi:MAG: glycine--tRNA ligase subunit beta [Hyphomonas sp.]|nr:glycine--tRNA ligase subunit beta [Hyphomonas sp.]